MLAMRRPDLFTERRPRRQVPECERAVGERPLGIVKQNEPARADQANIRFIGRVLGPCRHDSRTQQDGHDQRGLHRCATLPVTMVHTRVYRPNRTLWARVSAATSYNMAFGGS